MLIKPDRIDNNSKGDKKMKTCYFSVFIVVGFLSMTPFLHGVRAHRSSSNYGFDGTLSVERFTPDPMVQYPNGATWQTMEICYPTDKGMDNCGAEHAFIYGFQLGDSDPGTITSITLMVKGQNGGIFSTSPAYGVVVCDPNDNNPPVPCSPADADLTNCTNSDNFIVGETGKGTSEYTQTWDFGACKTRFVAGQKLAIFVALRVSTDPSPDDGTPYIDPPVVVTIAVSRAAQFVAINPCRVADTTRPNGDFGGPALQGGAVRDFLIPKSQCNIPAAATAYSLNITVVPHGPLGYLTVSPTGEGQPYVSTLNSYDGRVKANAAIVPAGDDGGVSFYVTDTTDLVLDIDGYFEPPSDSTLAFYPLAPCRVADTRDPVGDLGGPSLKGDAPRDFPILEATSCMIPDSAMAYSLNLTAVPHGPLGYLSVWPTGQTQPYVSTLNSYGGQGVANAAIVASGTGGKVSAYASNDTDLVIDINGYFAATPQQGLSLYPMSPCRVRDTRYVGNGQPFSGELVVDVVNSPCQPPSQSQAYVFNTTVVPSGPLGFLALWPDGGSLPVVSTLNSWDGAVTSNMAVVPASNQGEIDAYATDLTQLILDMSSYFAP